MFILAVVEGSVIYAYHDKIYSNKKRAEHALATMQKYRKLSTKYKVYEIDRVIFKAE